MLDQPTLELSRLLHSRGNQKSLLIADENTLGILPSLGQQLGLTALSNRVDVAQQLNRLGLECAFNDFEFDAFESNAFDSIFYRVSKEKPVVNHIINQAARILKPSGKLIFCGYKADGTKTYFDKAKKLWGGPATLKKDGANYIATLTLEETPATQLDDKDYSELRPTLTINGISYLSKPGLFGWNKIDKGSQLLIDSFSPRIESLQAPLRLLDLGCGYGFLTLASADWPATYRCATDNNCAAIRTSQANFELAGLNVDVVAADCANTIVQHFDLILCNPPFHQGFSVDGGLTDKFLASISRLLSENGTAVLVVNQFLPLERKAKELNFSTENLASDGSFKVIGLTRSHRAK